MKRSISKTCFVSVFAALFGITFLPIHLTGTAWAVPADTVSAQNLSNKSFDTTVDNVSKYTGLAAAVTAIGAVNVRTLLIPVSTNVAADVTVPANITLRFWGDGKLNITTGTVTINGPIQAPMKEIFSCTGTGKISFGGNKGIMDKVYPQWWGAKGDGATDDTAAVQATVDAAATIRSNNGGTVFLPAGHYYTSSPIILPRTSDAGVNLVRLQGAGMGGGTVFGSSTATGFPPNRALIEWKMPVLPYPQEPYRTWYQSIKDMTFLLPAVPGVSAIHYQIKNNSTQMNMLNETLQINLYNLLIYGDNTYHRRLIRLEGNMKVCNMENIYGDCCPGTSPAYDTIVLEVDSTWPEDDGSGINASIIRNIQGGVSRGGRHQVFKGRLCGSLFANCYNRYGSIKEPAYDIIGGRTTTITNIGNADSGANPQLRLSGCNSLIISELGLGNPVNAGSGAGNGIELVDTDDCVFTGQYRRSGDIAFSSVGRYNLTLDAASERNRFYNFNISGKAADEIQDRGTDNYCEAYDVSGANGWQYAGKLRQGDIKARSLSGLSGISGSGTAAKNLRGVFTVSGNTAGITVTFNKPEPDASYYLTLTPVSERGKPSVDSHIVTDIAKTSAGFTVNLAAAPGAGNSIIYDWHLIR
ncbi:MAG: glycosyl hydrolase family 28-related protein [bacterium]|nr:glycosyl hydrolase family 28-related protein [bacterium]